MLFSSGSFKCVLHYPLPSFYILTWLTPYNSSTGSAIAFFWKLSLNGSGSVHLQIVHTERQPNIRLPSGHWWWLLPLLPSATPNKMWGFFEGKTHAFISNSSSRNLINTWCAIKKKTRLINKKVGLQYSIHFLRSVNIYSFKIILHSRKSLYGCFLFPYDLKNRSVN